MKPRILFIQTHYPEFLQELYAKEPGLQTLDFDTQRRRVFATGFGSSDSYSHHLRELGCETGDVIVNAEIMQAQWAREHDVALCGNVHDQRRQIVAAQVAHYRPDILYVFEWCPLGDAFLADMKNGGLAVVGQIASPLASNRTYQAYDLMISSWPPIVDHFRKIGVAAEFLKLGFDDRVLDRLKPREPLYDVTFVGGFAPSHTHRIKWLERLLEDLDIAVFGYGVEETPENSPIRRHHHGPVWGWRMYEILQRSRVTLNRHARIDVRGSAAGNIANNMRLFEATGVGTCLVTERRENLVELFAPDKEVVAYDDEQDCIEKVKYYLEHEEQRAGLARAGQQRTLRNHTYAQRMTELLSLLEGRLGLTGSASRVSAIH